jgi:uncharacterized protein
VSDLAATTAGVADAASPSAGVPTRRKRSLKSVGQRWMRLIHVYTSMICLLTVLFFSVTGLTLNHPTWTLGDSPATQSATGTFPDEIALAPEIAWLDVAEYLRSEHGLRGEVAEYDATPTDGSITFKGPGFGADTFFDVEARTYDITIESQGSLGFFNDLHKGRDSASSWRWLIDVSAIFLVVISATGLGLQLFLKARRRSAVITAISGSILFVLFVLVALR